MSLIVVNVFSLSGATPIVPMTQLLAHINRRENCSTAYGQSCQECRYDTWLAQHSARALFFCWTGWQLSLALRLDQHSWPSMMRLKYAKWHMLARRVRCAALRGVKEVTWLWVQLRDVQRLQLLSVSGNSFVSLALIVRFLRHSYGVQVLERSRLKCLIRAPSINILCPSLVSRHSQINQLGQRTVINRQADMTLRALQLSRFGTEVRDAEVVMTEHVETTRDSKQGLY